MEVGVDFLAVAEHRLIPARVRSEWSRLQGKGLASIWALPAKVPFSMLVMLGLVSLACGVLFLLFLPLLLPQFWRFFDCGRAARCVLPLGFGKFMHLVVLYGYQGADTDAEQLMLTEQLFDAVLGEIAVVARGSALLAGWRFQRRAHQNPLLGKRDFGWALG